MRSATIFWYNEKTEKRNELLYASLATPQKTRFIAFLRFLDMNVSLIKLNKRARASRARERYFIMVDFFGKKKGSFFGFIKSFAPGGKTPLEAYRDMHTYDKTLEEIVDEVEKEYYEDSTSSEKSSADPIENVVTEDNNSSASKSAEEANRLTSDWFKESMEYNEEQARLNREFQQASAEKAMQFEADEAKKLREWQEALSNTQYQRAVDDLRKAGLNPILVAQYLSGASTPSGTSASGFSSSGSSASVSQSSATKAEVDLTSRARLIEAYLRSETSLKETDIKSVVSLISALIALAK